MLRFLTALTGTKNELVRQFLSLPRYTPEQILVLARAEATKYLQQLELLTLDQQAVDQLKLAFRRPIESDEDAQALGQDLTKAFEEFLERQKLVEPNPLYTYRWYLALMNEEQYISTINAINHIYQRFVTSRARWIQAQINAIQAELNDDIQNELEYEQLTEDLGLMLVEPGEA